MRISHHPERHQRAAQEFNELQNSDQGERLVESISNGLSGLRDRAFRRIHNDVEQYFGLDSMMMPLSLGDSEFEAKTEIDIWQLVEATLYASAAKYVDDEDWMRKWLGDLRLGRTFANDSVQRRIVKYWSLGPEERRLLFVQNLEHLYPEASRAPLVLYQLMPLAVQICIAIAFRKTSDANKLRKKQTFWLPGIMDCQTCHGAVLDNGERCPDCENPVWTYQWLLSAD